MSIEQWLEGLGAEIQDSIFDHLGPLRGHEGHAITADLVIRYTWERIDIGWKPDFDRWANSNDWTSDLPTSRDALKALLDECTRRGNVDDVPSMRIEGPYTDRIESMIDRIYVVSAAIVNVAEKRLFVQRRSGKTSYPWCWVTPGGKKYHHEMDWETLRRELEEEHNMYFSDVDSVGRLVYEYELPSEPVIVSCYLLQYTDVYPADATRRFNAGPAVAGFDWVSANELETLTLGPADHANRGKLLALIR